MVGGPGATLGEAANRPQDTFYYCGGWGAACSRGFRARARRFRQKGQGGPVLPNLTGKTASAAPPADRERGPSSWKESRRRMLLILQLAPATLVPSVAARGPIHRRANREG